MLLLLLLLAVVERTLLPQVTTAMLWIPFSSPSDSFQIEVVAQRRLTEVELFLTSLNYSHIVGFPAGAPNTVVVIK